MIFFLIKRYRIIRGLLPWQMNFPLAATTSFSADNLLPKFDGFVKNPSVPLEAGLRCNSFAPVPEELAPSGRSPLSFCAPYIRGLLQNHNF
jgi:hypothetical protein